MRQKEGSYYNQADLSADLRRIIDTQFFDDVVPGIGLPGVGKVDVTLTITERRTGNVSVGVGYGNRQQLVGRAEIGDNNFGGTGQSVSLLGETGGVANRSSLELGFTQPWIDNRHTSLSVSLFDKTVYRFSQSIGSLTGTTTGTATTYFETHTGGQFTVGRPFSKVYQGFIGVRFENIRVPALDLNAKDAGILQNGPLQTVTLRAIRSTRDFIQDPAVGAFDTFTGDIGRADVRPITLTNGQTPIGTFGNLNWFKYGLDTRRYFSPQGRRINIREKRNVFALRLMAATTSGTTPFSEQYFVGGAESLRGYREDRFWGKQMVLGSFEYRAPLAEALTGVLFVDAGDAWGGNYTNVSFNGFTQHTNFSPNLGAGLGIRVRTPIGPIRFDYGFGREGGRLHFSIGNVF
jgi:outer membrane protein insertion porin family